MKNKKKLAAKILKTSYKKVKIAADALEDVKKAITRADIRGLIAIKKVVKSKKNHQSLARARKNKEQKRKGRQKGKGSKKGSKHSVVTRKEKWMAKVRVQRLFLKEIKDKELVSVKNHRILYKRVKGGFFRNRRHIKLYMNEHHLFEENGEKTKQ
jgi:large subunit ribosomal protein L19e